MYKIHIQMDTTNRVATVLGIEVNPAEWGIYDSSEEYGLALAHYHPDADLVNFGWIKGIIVDYKNMKIVCQSYGNSQALPAPAEGLKVVQTMKSKPPMFYLRSVEGELLTVPEPHTTIVKGYEGCVVRVFKHMDHVFVSTHKRIIPNTSRWADSPPFLELYNQLGGPTTELFGDESSGSVVYTFMIVHPALIIASRMPLTEPTLLYLGAHYLSAVVDEPAVVSKYKTPEVLSVSEANDFLKHGFGPFGSTQSLVPAEEMYGLTPGTKLLQPGGFQDPRYESGEFVMMFEYTDPTKSKIRRCIKLQSQAYHWRVEMRANDPNLLHRVMDVAALKHRDLSNRLNRLEYLNRFLPIVLPNESELPYLVPTIIPENEIQTKVHARQRDTAVASLLFATHPLYQKTILQNYGIYLMFMKECKDWLLEIVNLESAPQESVWADIRESHPKYGPHVEKRLKNMIEVAKKNIAETPDGEIRTFSTQFGYFLPNEFGDSMYKIYKVYQLVKSKDEK